MNNNFDQALKRIEEAKNKGRTHLDLSFLFLSRLPTELFELTKLISLDLSGNYLFDIPDEINNMTDLLELNINDNCLEIRAIENIKQVWKLKYFYYQRNPFLNGVPPEIKHRGLLHIINYHRSFRGVRQDSRLNEAKVLFVGNGEVGKTTLMKKLTSPWHKVVVGQEPTTHGINIQTWHITYSIGKTTFQDLNGVARRKDVRRKIRLNLWDFGGQEIYHSTHQFFLTKRSIYILVWEARKEEDYTMFDYWFNIIKYLSANCHVIVVMNKSDIRDKQIDEHQFKKKFPNIFSFIKVSCVRNEGLLNLRRDISKILKTLQHINDKMPSSWKSIRKNIEELGRNYIPIERYYSICSMFHLDATQAEFLGEYLHDLGSILYFSKDSILCNSIIINPEWATKAVYSLVDSRKIQLNNGRFSLQDVSGILNHKAYPRDKHIEIIRLMEKFELCFNLVGTNDYIIPELLPSTSLDTSGYGFQQASLNVEFRYQFMPSGIIGRLICRLHHLIPKGLFWKHGMILSLETSYALIRAEPLNNKIILKITNMDAAQVLSIIRNDIGVIHDSLNLERDIDYFEMVPCICSECSNSSSTEYFKYTTLRKYFIKGKEKITCEKSVEEVDVNELLNGYEVKVRNNDLFYIILAACSKLQGHKKIINQGEDARNAFIASLIDSDKYVAKDQTRWGKSARGIKEGELDIKVESKHKLPLSIFEGFILKTFNKQVINNHLEKIFGYDPNGLKENYIVIYNESTNLSGQWGKYMQYIGAVSYKYELCDKVIDITNKYAYGTEVRIGLTSHNRSGETVKLYHLMVNMVD